MNMDKFDPNIVRAKLLRNIRTRQEIAY